MTTMTDAQAEAARLRLAEYEAAKEAEARAAENDKRAACRAVVQPLADVMAPLRVAADAVRARVAPLASGDEWDLSNLARNVVQTVDGLAARVDRRIADTEPVPAPPAPIAPPA